MYTPSLKDICYFQRFFLGLWSAMLLELLCLTLSLLPSLAFPPSSSPPPPLFSPLPFLPPPPPPPLRRLPIEVSFAATQEREYNFNLQCSVHRKPTPLLLNVKAEGYVINVGLAYTTPKGKEVQLPTERGAKRIIDFGQVGEIENTRCEMFSTIYSLHGFPRSQ